MFCVYILFSEHLQKFYIGQTEDLDTRLLSHNSPDNPNWTRQGIPWVLYLSIPCKSRLSATRLEKFIKKQKSSAFIISLKDDSSKLESILKKIDC